MAAARRKAPTQVAPQTIEEATSTIDRYMAMQSSIEGIKAEADASIQQIEGARDGMVAPLEQAQKELFKQLRAWWAVAKDQMTDGKRKSIELAGAIIGERTNTPSLKLPKGVKQDEFIEKIRAALADDATPYIRTKLELDKLAIIKTLRKGEDDTMAERLAQLGAGVSQATQFFIDRAGKREADPELVDVEGESA
jgi:phage host-nuclease inhibitor protein Gam